MPRKKDGYKELRSKLAESRAKIISLEGESRMMREEVSNYKDIANMAHEELARAKTDLHEERGKVRWMWRILYALHIFNPKDTDPYDQQMDAIEDNVTHFLRVMGTIIPYLRCPNNPCGCYRDRLAESIATMLNRSKDHSVTFRASEGANAGVADHSRCGNVNGDPPETPASWAPF